jgi:hypothetical protein
MVRSPCTEGRLLMANKSSGGGLLGQLISWATLICILALGVYLVSSRGWDGTAQLILNEWLPGAIDWLKGLGQAVWELIHKLPGGQGVL